MSLEIVRYKNYGCQMSGYSEDRSVKTHQFYWCFFELNNKKVIAVYSTGNWDEKGLPLGWDIDSRYDLCYEFGEEFNGYWDRHWEYTKVHWELGHTSQEENDLVCDYYKKHIDPCKDLETGIVCL